MAYTYNYRMSSFFHIFKILPQGILQVFLFPSSLFIFVVLLYNYVNFVYDDMLFDIVFGCRDERCVNNNYTFKYHPFLPLPIRCIFFSLSLLSPSLSLSLYLSSNFLFCLLCKNLPFSCCRSRQKHNYSFGNRSCLDVH